MHCKVVVHPYSQGVGSVDGASTADSCHAGRASVVDAAVQAAVEPRASPRRNLAGRMHQELGEHSQHETDSGASLMSV